MLVFIEIIFLTFLVFQSCLADENTFHHDVDYEHESGERFKLKSKGRFADIIDLDDVLSIKRLLCRHGIIMIAFQDDANPPLWKPGQILLGSSKWKCTHSNNSPHGAGIYARIKQIIHPKESRMDIVTEKVGPFDLLEEADIQLHYKGIGKDKVNPEENGKGNVKHRQRRYSSNLLSDMLNTINWTANVDLNIPNNYNKTLRKEEHQFSLERFYGMNNFIYWDLKQNDSENGRANFTSVMTPFYKMDCFSCYGLTTFNYVFELVIYKINNKPVIKKYISQIDAETEIHNHYTMHFPRESALTGTKVLFARPVTEMFRVPLAVVPKLPPVELIVTTNDLVYAQVHGYVAGKTSIDMKFNAAGKYSLSQNFASQLAAKGDVSVREWNVTGNVFHVESPSKINITSAIIQTIVLNASVHWSGKDVSAILSPPAIMTIKPEVSITSSLEELSRSYRSNINITGDFQLSKARFIVDAFGMHIWNVLLASGFHHQLSILSTELGDVLKVNCRGIHERGPPYSMEEVCGPMKKKLSRTDESFQTLRVLSGNSLVFLEQNQTSWCGNINTSCVPCTTVTRGPSHLCSTRYMTPELAYAIVRLEKFIQAEFPQRKLVIVQAFDEETFINPNRCFGNESLFYEGRAAKISLTRENSTTRLENSETILKTLGQLAVCSLFDFVRFNKDEHVFEVATRYRDEDTSINCTTDPAEGRCIFEKAMRITGDRINYNSSSSKLPRTFSLGQSFPVGSTPEIVCGAQLSNVTRFSFGIENRMYYYKENDVNFAEEGSSEKWCGHPLRACVKCAANQTKKTWDWCSTRIMTPRLALRIKRLATILKIESATSQLHVIKAFTEETEINPVLHVDEGLKLYQEGRAARLSLDIGSMISLGRMASLAIVAGFDYVRYNDMSFLEVFVKPQDDFQPDITMFPSGTVFPGVPLSSLFDRIEYKFMHAHKSESRKPLLLDGYNSNVKISERYNSSDFMCPGYRYFRLDDAIVQCLERVSDDIDQKVEVIPNSGYRVRSVNLDNIDIRHPQERYRFQLGQAVEIRIGKNPSVEDLISLGKSILRSCPVVTRPQHRGIGIGCHQDRLYIDIRPTPIGDEDKFLTIWNSGGTTLYIELLARVYAALTGGPVIYPFDKTTACEVPIGKDYVHLNFQMNKPGTCHHAKEAEFCSATKQHRQNEGLKLQVRMSSAAGADNLPRPEIIGEINACVADVCGGCSGSGPAWDKKVITCSRMVKKYIDHASRPFQNLKDKVTFFNTENSESTVHSMACHFGFICVENVQLYSLLMPLITATYRPDMKKSVQEKLFSVEDNPSPLLEIVSQELAIRAFGIVRVFIDNERDLTVLRRVLKVVMVYNKNVTKIEFHVTDNIKPEDVRASIQRKMEYWASSSCTTWSRFSIVPYTVSVIPSHRRKRSTAFSIPRNHIRMASKNWEFEWLKKV